MNKLLSLTGVLLLLVLSAQGLFAADEAAKLPSGPDPGHTAWMLTATLLVLLMTIPGLSLFYGGLVRSKNVLSILMQCFFMTAVMSIIWVVCGYSLAAGGANNLLWGDFENLFLKNLKVGSGEDGAIPESVFVSFQMTFFIITPALIVGAFAERMKFSAVLIFTILWALLSYLPIWHMAWSSGIKLFDGGEQGNPLMGPGQSAIDFAGGTVVHINAGIAGLVACIMLGRRKRYPESLMTPHNVPYTVIGASLLWVGWFGFNAGSRLAADGVAGYAMLVTQIAAAAAVIAWVIVEWMINGKPTAVGAATGAVAGLVAITPASGTTDVMGALIIGLSSGAICYICATSLKRKFGYDDSLDVFGVHGVGGIVGAIMTGMFIREGAGEAGFAQVIVQAKAVVFTMVWSAIAALIALFAAKVLVGLRVSENEEDNGLDQGSHGESAYS